MNYRIYLVTLSLKFLYADRTTWRRQNYKNTFRISLPSAMMGEARWPTNPSQLKRDATLWVDLEKTSLRFFTLPAQRGGQKEQP